MAIIVPDDETTIQAAVDAAGAGGTVLVRAGTYTENVTIIDDNITLIALEEVVLQGTGSSPGIGIEIDNANGITIIGFEIKGYTMGIKIGEADYPSNNNKLIRNRADNNGYNGIWINGNSNKLIRNRADNNEFSSKCSGCHVCRR